MNSTQFSVDQIIFVVLVCVIVYIVMSLIWDFFSTRAYAIKSFESCKYDLIFTTINDSLEIKEYWFVDDETTTVSMQAKKIAIEYTKHTKPNKVVEVVSIFGKIEFSKKFYEIEPFKITFSQSDQAILDNDSLEVIRVLDAKLGLHEQIIIKISKQVNLDKFGPNFDAETF